MEKTRILVLGSSGRLGGLLRASWARDVPGGAEFFFQTRRKIDFDPFIRWEPGQNVSGLPTCDVIFALWGRTSGDVQQLDDNTHLASEARRIATARGARCVIHLSSAAVYGPTENAKETQELKPANAYGHSKKRMESAISGFDDNGPKHLCLRLSNVIGADSLAPALKSDAKAMLDQFEDGEGPIRSFIGTGDLAKILISLTELSQETLPSVLNVATSVPLPMQALLKAANRSIAWRKAPIGAIQRVTMATDRLAHLLPQIDPLTSSQDLVSEWQQLEERT